MQKLEIASYKGTYPLYCERGLLDRIGPMLLDLPSFTKEQRIQIVTDENVGSLYGERVFKNLEAAGFKPGMFTMPPGEDSKSMHELETLFQGMVREGIGRGDAVLALGGGVTGDLAGFAAHTYMRGISLVQAPTSLLAQIDSAVGGKVAVNLPEGKNLVGGFCPPRAVFVDVDTLSTLPERVFSDGMAEMVKYGVIGSRALFEKLETTGREKMRDEMESLVFACCRMKQEVVEKDETETGERMILNFGHTFGHIIEKSFHYNRYSHGEAVAVGMVRMAAAGEKKGWTCPGTAERIRRLLKQYHLPWQLKEEEESIVSEVFPKTVRVDKKNSGKRLTIVVAEEIGRCRLEAVTPDLAEELWAMGRE